MSLSKLVKRRVSACLRLLHDRVSPFGRKDWDCSELVLEGLDVVVESKAT